MGDFSHVMDLALRIIGAIFLILTLVEGTDTIIHKLSDRKVRPSQEFKLHLKNTQRVTSRYTTGRTASQAHKPLNRQKTSKWDF